MSKNTHLTRTESKVARWLTRGKSYSDVAAQMEISINTLRVHLTNIRKKTKIHDFTTGAMEQYLDDQLGHVKELKIRDKPLPLSTSQLKVLRLLSVGTPYKTICNNLNICKSTAMNHASLGCARLGVHSKPLGPLERQRMLKRALQDYDEHHNPQPHKPTVDDF